MGTLTTWPFRDCEPDEKRATQGDNGKGKRRDESEKSSVKAIGFRDARRGTAPRGGIGGRW